jgi:hypothetical protein
VTPDNELASAAATAPEVDLTTFGRKSGRPSRNTIWITTDEQGQIHIRSGQGLVGEWNGRDEVAAALRRGMTSLGAWRVLPTAANGHPAAAGYLRRPNQTTFLPFVICVLDITGGKLADIAAFEAADLVTAFGLPAYL